MPSFLVLGNCFLLVLSNHSEEVGGFSFSMATSMKMKASTTSSAWGQWELGFWMAASRQKWCCCRGIILFSHFILLWLDLTMHDEGLVRICLPLKSITSIELERFRWVFSIFFSGRRKTQERRSLCWTPPARMLALFVGHLFLALLLSVFLYGHPYESSHMFRIEIWSYTKCGYSIDEKQFLAICIVFLIYSTIFS